MKFEICIMSLNKGVRLIIKIGLYRDKYRYLVKKLPLLVCESKEWDVCFRLSNTINIFTIEFFPTGSLFSCHCLVPFAVLSFRGRPLNKTNKMTYNRDPLPTLACSRLCFKMTNRQYFLSLFFPCSFQQVSIFSYYLSILLVT